MSKCIWEGKGGSKDSEHKVELIPIWLTRDGGKVQGVGPALPPSVCKIWQTDYGYVG